MIKTAVSTHFYLLNVYCATNKCVFQLIGNSMEMDINSDTLLQNVPPLGSLKTVQLLSGVLRFPKTHSKVFKIFFLKRLFCCTYALFSSDNKTSVRNYIVILNDATAPVTRTTSDIQR